MKEPQNIFMYAEKLTVGDKLVAIGDAVRAGARGYAYYFEGIDYKGGKEFVRISWLEDDGSLPLEYREKIHEILCGKKIKFKSMGLDVALEDITYNLVRDNDTP